MKRIPRYPEKFEIVRLFQSMGQQHNFKLRDKKSQKSFLESIAKSIDFRKSPIVLYGSRTEAMFGYVVASLGRCSIVKQEDSGEIFTESGKIAVPDYRILTSDGRQFLVEVKNCHKTLTKFSMKAQYFDGLREYSKLMGVNLRIAIYWSKWNIWTLISQEDLILERGAYVIDLLNSYKQNQMAEFGDLFIGIRVPLVLRIITDPNKPRTITRSGNVTYTIGAIQLLNADTDIVDEQEKKIAYYLFLFGDWPISRPRAKIENNELIAIDFEVKPEEQNQGQGFEIIGSLSGMISRFFNVLTAPSGQIEKIFPMAEPGSLGITIPTDYKGKQLSLWRFTVQPNIMHSGNTQKN